MLGEILVTIGALALGFAAYLYWGTAAREGTAQRAFARELYNQWSGPGQLAALTSRTGMAPGRPFALLRIPQFGANWQFAVVQGTGAPQLALAPGHVPGTALPGEPGNFAVVAHRVTAGSPFWHLPSLHMGSVIDVETISGVYVYRVTRSPRWVRPGDNSVIAPDPYRPNDPARLKMITLITCDPPVTGSYRVVVTGVLVRTLPRQLGS
jgi:sortase A